ncbi:MAG: TIR domain-containing protein [Opitutus sp.]|nr:TIR domain-containing protein [Opitutus sp.]
MSPASKAVFVSYAKEDATAAKRICGALRDAGVEVWFDQNELVGGDAWDAKIRGQIGACALFVPVVSAATQARREGYFRLEWKLADERTHLMAEGTPFILPVVIDETKDREALVPKSFLAVQWTRIGSADSLTAFGERVKTLLVGDAEVRASSPATATNAGGTHALPGKSVRQPWLVTAIAGLVILGILAFWRPWNSPPAPAMSAPAAKPPLDLASTAGLAKADAKSIAVLPFSNMSDDKDANAFFADGIHEDILTNLANIAELKVISRTSVMQYRDTKLPLRKIAQDLGVAYVLEGSVRRDGAQVRVTGQLIRAATDEHVWAKNYDRELKDIFAIQTALATEIAGALHSVLSPQEKTLIARVPTASLDAYDLFRKVREVRNRLGTSVESLREQEQLLERAVAIDPRFGLACAKLAWVRSFRSATIGGGDDTRAAGAREAVEKAKAIIPDSPEFFLGRGWFLYFVEKDHGGAFAEFQKAAELSPSFAEARYALAMVYRRQGLWRETLQTLHEVERIDPANPEYAQEIAVTALSGRRYAEAEVALRRALALGRTGSMVNSLRAHLPFMSRGELPSDELVAELPGTARSDYDLMRGNLWRRWQLTGRLLVYSDWQRMARRAPCGPSWSSRWEISGNAFRASRPVRICGPSWA